MKKYFIAFCMLVACTGNLLAETHAKKVSAEEKGLASINMISAKAHVEFLAADEL